MATMHYPLYDNDVNRSLNTAPSFVSATPNIAAEFIIIITYSNLQFK